jgi:signal transduction histidine kinase
MKFRVYFVFFFLLTICSGGFAVFLFTQNLLLYAGLFLFVTVLLAYHLLRILFKTLQDIEDFTEAVRYRDFSKRYPESESNLNNFYRHFNTISDTFLAISRDKESQQQYLKRIIDLVNTGILAYDMDTLDTIWMNDSCKTMFQSPYLKNIN